LTPSAAQADDVRSASIKNLDCVIVTFNSLGVIDGCLNSLLESGVEPSHIYVVDNGSTDDTVRHVTRGYSGVNVLPNQENLGFSKANNIGAQEGSSGMLLFANPDTVFLPGAVSRLVGELTSNATTGICGPLLVDLNLSPKPESYLLPPSVPGVFLQYTYLWKPVYMLRRLLEGIHRRSDLPRRREVLSGACMSLCREDFLRVGGFDERFFMYAEDMDLCEKVRGLGLGVVQLPGAEVVHLGGGSYSSSQTVLFNTLRSRDLLTLKNSRSHSSLATKRLLITAGLSLRWAAYGLLQKMGSKTHSGVSPNLREGIQPFLTMKLASFEPLEFPPR
jgi:GT2 family glycosyltransferase